MADSNFLQVVLLCHYDGIDGQMTFTDSSRYNHAYKTVNNPVISTAQKKFGTASFGNNTNDKRMTWTHQGSEFDFGSGDFTIEGWVYRINHVGQGFIASKRFNDGIVDHLDWQIYSHTDGNIYINMGTLFGQVNGGAVTDATWTSFAISRVGNTARTFLDGIVQNTIDVTGASVGNTTPDVTISGNDGSNEVIDTINGYVDEIRLTKGVGRYTANYTPSATAFPDSYAAGASSLNSIREWLRRQKRRRR